MKKNILAVFLTLVTVCAVSNAQSIEGLKQAQAKYKNINTQLDQIKKNKLEQEKKHLSGILAAEVAKKNPSLSTIKNLYKKGARVTTEQLAKSSNFEVVKFFMEKDDRGIQYLIEDLFKGGKYDIINKLLAKSSPKFLHDYNFWCVSYDFPEYILSSKKNVDDFVKYISDDQRLYMFFGMIPMAAQNGFYYGNSDNFKYLTHKVFAAETKKGSNSIFNLPVSRRDFDEFFAYTSNESFFVKEVLSAINAVNHADLQTTIKSFAGSKYTDRGEAIAIVSAARDLGLTKNMSEGFEKEYAKNFSADREARIHFKKILNLMDGNRPSSPRSFKDCVDGICNIF